MSYVKSMNYVRRFTIKLCSAYGSIQSIPHDDCLYMSKICARNVEVFVGPNHTAPKGLQNFAKACLEYI